jgi:hypothetical protein
MTSSDIPMTPLDSHNNNNNNNSSTHNESPCISVTVTAPGSSIPVVRHAFVDHDTNEMVPGHGHGHRHGHGASESDDSTHDAKYQHSSQLPQSRSVMNTRSSLRRRKRGTYNSLKAADSSWFQEAVTRIHPSPSATESALSATDSAHAIPDSASSKYIHREVAPDIDPTTHVRDEYSGPIIQRGGSVESLASYSLAGSCIEEVLPHGPTHEITATAIFGGAHVSTCAAVARLEQELTELEHCGKNTYENKQAQDEHVMHYVLAEPVLDFDDAEAESKRPRSDLVHAFIAYMADIWVCAILMCGAPLLIAYQFAETLQRVVSAMDSRGLSRSIENIAELPRVTIYEYYAWLVVICPIVCCFIKVWYILRDLFGPIVAVHVLPESKRLILALTLTGSIYGLCVGELGARLPHALLVSVIVTVLFAGALVVYRKVGRIIKHGAFWYLHFGEIVMYNSILWAYSIVVPTVFFSVSASARAAIRCTMHPALSFLGHVILRYVGRRLRNVRENAVFTPYFHFMCQMALWGRFLVANMDDLWQVAVLSLILQLEQFTHTAFEFKIDSWIYKHIFRMSDEYIEELMTSDQAVALHVSMINSRRVIDITSVISAGVISILYKFSLDDNSMQFDSSRVWVAVWVQLGIAAVFVVVVGIIFPYREIAQRIAWDQKPRQFLRSAQLYVLSQTSMFLFFFSPFFIEHMQNPA